MDCGYCEIGKLEYEGEKDGYMYYKCSNKLCERYYKFSDNRIVGIL